MIENVINNPRIPKAGTIWAWGSSSIPYGWLLCDGSAVSRTNYKALFSVIGTSYGSGDGTTTFNLPNGKIAVANSVQCKGNGKTLGLTDGTTQYGLGASSNSGAMLTPATGKSGASLTTSNRYAGAAAGIFGISTDKTKSGIVADQSNQTRAIIKY